MSEPEEMIGKGRHDSGPGSTTPLGWVESNADLDSIIHRRPDERTDRRSVALNLARSVASTNDRQITG